MGGWLRSPGSKEDALLCKTLWSWKLSGETSYFIPFLAIVVLAAILRRSMGILHRQPHMCKPVCRLPGPL